MEYMNKLKSAPTLYKICFGFVIAFICFLLYSYFNKTDLINTQLQKETTLQETFISSTPAIFTMYYADWCPHCVAAKPEFRSVMKNSQKINGQNIKYVMVDCEKNPEEAEKAGVEGFPTFILDINGKKEVYQGERTERGFEEFLSNMLS